MRVGINIMGIRIYPLSPRIWICFETNLEKSSKHGVYCW